MTLDSSPSSSTTTNPTEGSAHAAYIRMLQGVLDETDSDVKEALASASKPPSATTTAPLFSSERTGVLSPNISAVRQQTPRTSSPSRESNESAPKSPIEGELGQPTFKDRYRNKNSAIDRSLTGNSSFYRAIDNLQTWSAQDPLSRTMQILFRGRSVIFMHQIIRVKSIFLI